MPDTKENKASAELSFYSTRREMNSGKETDNKGVNNKCRANTRGGNQAKRTNGGEEGRARLKTGLPPALTGTQRPGRQICLTILNQHLGETRTRRRARTHATGKLTCRHTELRGESEVAVASTPNYLKAYRKLGVRSSPHLLLCQSNRRTSQRDLIRMH